MANYPPEPKTGITFPLGSAGVNGDGPYVTVGPFTRSLMPDGGWSGPRFAENLRTAKKAVDHFGGQKLRTVLEQSGMGSHPEIVRAFWKIGQILTQPKSNNDNARLKSSGKSLGELFYPGFNGGK